MEDDMKERVMESGRLAFWGGVSLADAPFAKGSLARRWWLAGWRKGRSERLEKIR